MTVNEHQLPDQCLLPNRRTGIIVTVRHWYDSARTVDMDVGFNFDRAGYDGRVVEVFTIPKKAPADLDVLLADSCKALSLAMRAGVTIAALAERMGELREEGQGSGKPASLIGTICSVGTSIERDQASPYIIGDTQPIIAVVP